MPTGVYIRDKKLSNLFQKGHVPWNKGKLHKKGHRFLKGCIPWNKGKKLHYKVWNKKNKINFFCKECNKVFQELLTSKRKFCSRKCYGEYLKKISPEQVPNWKGGIAKTWAKRNREKSRFLTNRRRAKIRGNGGSFTQDEWEKLKEDCSYSCKICGLSEPEIKLTIDHIQPVSKGGNSYITNIQPLCLSCNSKKSNKT